MSIFHIIQSKVIRLCKTEKPEAIHMTNDVSRDHDSTRENNLDPCSNPQTEKIKTETEKTSGAAR